MAWVNCVKNYYDTIGNELDEITLFNKQGGIVESTATAGTHCAATLQELATAPVGKMFTLDGEKYMIVQKLECLAKLKSPGGFIVVDRLRGTEGEGTCYVLCKSKKFNGGQMSEGMEKFSKWCETQGYK